MLEDRIIEFGKYKGSTYKDILVNQRDYCLWMIKQTWCRARYPLLYNYIVGNTSNAQPPEKVIPVRNLHNEYQALFTNNWFMDKFIEDIFPEDEPLVERVTFEHLCNADIMIEVVFTPKQIGWRDYILPGTVEKRIVLVEIKPGVSNDYPDILRQMRSQRHSYEILAKGETEKVVQVLATAQYTGDTEFEVVQNMYGGIKIMFPF